MEVTGKCCLHSVGISQNSSGTFRYTRGAYPVDVLMSRQGSATWGLAVSELPHWSMR